mmetsp:Transcript_20982/g.34202  ORF Transcript_20982/g.34202 Transcript_20982/m.34202 type:complete len:201 (+) Transcript_20982:1079-1681(+)|eukprot:CAMPEP_0203756770 /NCGR_PEP_ID=MMETSP0098-20131031/9973_1 /ASSEMBLY_ACC=CAM_ASM_000208 /TAXON_ID=96639 /ORGANISM=" , Strain NY0313808BC1" /LENGTH=200 /DNA_ID=CAMNT_0050648759 /DNA_START=216 /DNA_END=818 /DNA_ORIENTATION=-
MSKRPRTEYRDSDGGKHISGKRKRRRSWTASEDELLKKLAKEHTVLVNRTGTITPRVTWVKVADSVESRTAKQCRDRYHCLLAHKGHLKKAEKTLWTTTEDSHLLALHQEYSNQWVKIASYFPERNDNMIKSRFRQLSHSLGNAKPTMTALPQGTNQYDHYLENCYVQPTSTSFLPVDNELYIDNEDFINWCSDLQELLK